MTRLNFETAWSEFPAHDPVDSSWGFFSYGDACGAIGGGMGAFLWFPDQEKLLTFIRDVLPFNPPGPCNADHEKVDRDCTRLIEQFQAGEISLEEMRSSLNTTLKGFSQIEWLGTKKELLEGDHPYAMYLRARYQLDRWPTDHIPEVEKDSPLKVLKIYGKPVKPKEAEGFMEMISMWGI